MTKRGELELVELPAVGLAVEPLLAALLSSPASAAAVLPSCFLTDLPLT